MNDIERAIELLEHEEALTQNFINNSDEGEGVTSFHFDYIDALNLAISALEKQLNGGWIPVSERLPNSTQRVLVTLENEMVLEVFYINNKFKFIGPVKGGGMKEIHQDNPVIAWQPLPAPF